MNINAKTVDLPLAKGALFSIEDISQVQVVVLSGDVWLTIDEDQQDNILGAGDSIRSNQHQRALVSALDESTLRLCTRSTAQATPSGSFHGILGRLLALALRRGSMATTG